MKSAKVGSSFDQVGFDNIRYFDSIDYLYRQFFGLATELVIKKRKAMRVRVWLSSRWQTDLNTTALEVVYQYKKNCNGFKYIEMAKVEFIILPPGIETDARMGLMDTFGLDTFCFERKDLLALEGASKWPRVKIDCAWNPTQLQRLVANKGFADRRFELEKLRLILTSEAVSIRNKDIGFHMSKLKKFDFFVGFDLLYVPILMEQTRRFAEERETLLLPCQGWGTLSMRIPRTPEFMREALKGHAIKEWALFMFSFDTHLGIRFTYDRGTRYQWFLDEIFGCTFEEQFDSNSDSSDVSNYSVFIPGMSIEVAKELGRKYGNLALLVGNAHYRYVVNYEKPEHAFDLCLN